MACAAFPTASVSPGLAVSTRCGLWFHREAGVDLRYVLSLVADPETLLD